MKLKMMSLLLIAGFSFICAIAPVFAQDDGQTVDTDGNNIVIDTEQAANTIVAVTESTTQGLSRIVSGFLNRLFNITQNEYVRVLMVIAGVILLLAGWRIYNGIIILSGAIIGGAVALAAVGNAGVVIEVVAFVVGAAIGAALGYFLYYLAVFMIGAYIGIVVTTLLAQSLNLLPLSPLILLIMAIIAGVITLGLSFELLVFLSSVLGAQLIVVALGLSPAPIWLILLVLLGVVLQINLTRRAGYRVRRRPSRRLID